MSPLLRLSAVAAAAEENESYEDQPEDVLIVEKIANAVSAVHKKTSNYVFRLGFPLR